jgi:hypothetical protein
MIELTTGESILAVLIIAFGIIIVFAPWWSLTNLGKLDKIAFELEMIREELERRRP